MGENRRCRERTAPQTREKTELEKAPQSAPGRQALRSCVFFVVLFFSFFFLFLSPLLSFFLFPTPVSSFGVY